MQLIVTTSRGLGALLHAEVAAIVGKDARVTNDKGVVRVETTELRDAYNLCMWSRVANRVLLVAGSFEAHDAEALYSGVREVDWNEHLDVRASLAVDFVGQGEAVTHTHFGALKVKDAIVDQFRQRCGERPRVDTTNPDLRVNVFMTGSHVQLALDLSGESLHRRGYRRSGEAPVKENLAAALLLLCEWPARWQREECLLDPTCGCGTLPIEAALIAADAAPALDRDRFGFERWKGHQAAVWQQVVKEAQQRDRRRFAPPLVRIFGSDKDPAALALAMQNAKRANVGRWIELERRPLAQVDRCGFDAGLFVCNPPYGKRLGEVTALERLYLQLGDILKQRFGGFSACVLSGAVELSAAIGLKATAKLDVKNGPLDCRALVYPVTSTSAVTRAEEPLRRIRRLLSHPAQAEMFANRLRKNWKRLRKWSRRAAVSCYRLYDADLPEFAAAIDLYEESLHIQEYAPPSTVDPQQAQKRLRDLVLVASELLDIEPDRVFVKVRKRQRGAEQYERLEHRDSQLIVGEGGHRFLLNLGDFLDTGLFLDHRKTRALVGELARGRDFLNLFCYTATATVYAARGGARSTTSVDLSSTYLAWARRNFALNQLDEQRNRLERADCLQWLERQSRRFGLVFCDPPTFSNSKRMHGSFDVQRDHVALVKASARLLTRDGELIFSNNNQRFVIDRQSLADFELEEISDKTLSEDFARNPRIHNCWRIRRKH